MRRWRTTLNVGDVFRSEDIPLPEKARVIAARVKGLSICDDYLADLADELAEQDSADGFDWVWSAIYDWADENRLWIDTTPWRAS